MATFKHISSKNADYGAAEQYLTFEHDEFTMKPTRDENGQIVPRTGYLISSLNCGDEDFAIACMRSNLKYGKNQKREDVKSHHYIISFDPRDAQDNGLTVDRAQELGEQFCREHFPGHQALVCTHPDGHNHSGNIHVHIVINSLRIAEVPLLPYMERPADTNLRFHTILQGEQVGAGSPETCRTIYRQKASECRENQTKRRKRRDTENQISKKKGGYELMSKVTFEEDELAVVALFQENTRKDTIDILKDTLEALEETKEDPLEDDLLETIASAISKLQMIEDKYYYSLDLNRYLNNLEDDAYEE